jgi:CheY-like chemotaxis protein
VAVRSPHRPQTVLVVEDDPGLRELYRRALSAAGYAAVAVEDGLDALRRIDADGPPAAVVLDLHLPRVGGRDVHRELQARGETRHIPIVIVTGSDVLGFSPDEVACVLRKPIDPDALVAAVEKCLKARRSWY